MDTAIPSASTVRARLEQLSWPQVRALCKEVGAPTSTVWKVRTGETTNPGIETIRLIWPGLVALVPDAGVISADNAPQALWPALAVIEETRDAA